MNEHHKNDLLGVFAQHAVACNLLMVIMLLSGALALKQINIQFFPNFELDTISISTTWSGASAEDIETAITTPLEQRLRNVDGVKEMNSTSAPGASGITLEFEEHTDIVLALDQVKREVDNFDNLPDDAEDPKVVRATRYESIARLLISGPQDFAELRNLVRRFERELLDAGIDKVDIVGLPEETVRISIDAATLQRLGIDLNEIGARIDALSQDLPAGLVGERDGTRELRSLSKRRDPASFDNLPILLDANTRIDLGDIATIERVPKERQAYLTVNGKRALVVVLRRAESGDSLAAADTLRQWLNKTHPTLPPSVQIQVFSERWQLIKQRIGVLVKNGAGGLAMVLVVLFLFLSGRVAAWVAVGIPVSFMATLAVLYLSGGSINMISLFALIMALGIIVDDAIVVGEDAQTHFDQGEDSLVAAEGGARRMLAPVMASSLTTIAAFLPLMLVGGRIGNIMSAIPLVIVAVIIASLFEAFLVLPGHLRHAFRNAHRARRQRLRLRLDKGFVWFRERLFRRLVTVALEFRWTVIAFAFGCLILSLGLVVGGRLNWVFFPSPDSTTVFGNVRFVAGTPRTTVDAFLVEMEQALDATVAELGEDVVQTYYTVHGASSSRGRSINGPRVGSIYVELSAPDERATTNAQFVRAWRKRVRQPAGVESLTITARRTGPSSRDLDVRLIGGDPHRVKAAALQLAEAIKAVPGTSAVDDDLPYGREQLIYELTPAGTALGLSIASLGQQLRTAYQGRVVQQFQDGADEVEVRVELPQRQQQRLRSLDELPIRLPEGGFAPLASVARWSYKQGFETLRHAGGRLSANVSANVDAAVTSVDAIEAALRETTLAQLVQSYNIDYSFEGRSRRQRDTLSDMRTGMAIGLLCIYLVLAAVFSSYGWPVIVMSAIPMGLTGAILGHWAMGMNLTILSLFGFFGLSGIVVNNSIILVMFYKHLRASGTAAGEALVEAACQRLRAVLVTSLTTIAGLTPLLFETSRQAQFLIPMATSIAFGLAFATLLILLVVPAMLSVYEDWHAGLRGDGITETYASTVPSVSHTQ